MGKRREPRHPIRIPVRIFGTDAGGQMFSENAFSFDISHQGARLDGIKTRLKPGDIIGLSQGKNKSRFCVQWVGQPGTTLAGQIGLASIAPEINVWDAPLAARGTDSFVESGPAPERRKPLDRRQSSDRRDTARLKCMISVQMLPAGQAAPIWGKATDMSVGGCFVEMPIPLAKSTKLTLGIWIKESKLHAAGRVVSSRPGFGVGIQFTEMSELDTAELREFLKSITQIPL
jgi:hypothetical protein